MKYFKIFLSFLFFYFLNFLSFSSALDDFLTNQKDVTYIKIGLLNGAKESYELRFKQPIDHKDTSKGFFFQKIYLNHFDFSKPMVFVTEGYSLYSNKKNELTGLINGNQLSIEHRYFGVSKPDSLNYSYLNLDQACADLHRITLLFKQIYKSKWICTGVSKGGTTTVLYKYFYPLDVDVSVAYVAPFANSTEDNRVFNFLDSVGSNECRNAIFQFQIRLLENRNLILPILKSVYTSSKGFEFNYLSFEEAFEIAVLEFSFAFWQWGSSCNQIPTSKSSIKELADYFIKSNPMDLFSDFYMNYYGSHYYQAGTEMGYYAYKTNKFSQYLKVLSSKSLVSAIFSPSKMKLTYNAHLFNNVKNWLSKSGNNIIYIYGALDTWTSCAIIPSKFVNSKSFVLENKHHGNANVSEMNKNDKKKFMKLITSWLK